MHLWGARFWEIWAQGLRQSYLRGSRDCACQVSGSQGPCYVTLCVCLFLFLGFCFFVIIAIICYLYACNSLYTFFFGGGGSGLQGSGARFGEGGHKEPGSAKLRALIKHLKSSPSARSPKHPKPQAA